jgi:hypothetical protein
MTSGLALLPSNGFSPGSRDEWSYEATGCLQAQGGEKYARGNANQVTKDVLETRGTQIGHRGQIFKWQNFLYMVMHDLDRAFDSLPMSGKGLKPCCVFIENGWYGLHGVLPFPTVYSSQVYSFRPALRRQTDITRQYK